MAPAPGINWSGSTETWLDQARRNGWAVKNSAADAKLGSIVILSDQANKMMVGIVRDVKDTGIRFDTLAHNKQVQQKMITYQSDTEYKIMGYIWPERTAPRPKLIIAK